jgi:uncharacterized protein
MTPRREFEWDEGKAARNLIKHGVSFSFATRVFLDAGLVDLDASRPEDEELRHKTVGMIDGRVYAVVYTERSNITRIISARRCNVQEARVYGAIQI